MNHETSTQRLLREGRSISGGVDNFTVNAVTVGGGPTFASDDIGSVHYPRVKATWGVDGTFNDISDATGKRLPVKIAEVASLPLPTGASTEATLASVLAQLVSIFGAVDGLEATNMLATGDVAHDAVDSGNPVKIGGVARGAADPTPTTPGDRANFMADTLGKQVVLVGSTPDRVTSGTVNLVNVTAANVIAGIASTRYVVTSILVTNAHATVNTKVEIRDGTTVKIVGFAAALGGGFSLAPGTPLFVAAVGAAVTARCVTTGADVDVSISGFLTA